MIKTTYIQQNRINTLVLAKLFQLAQTERESVWEEQLVSFFAKRVGRIRIKMALQTALEDGFVEYLIDDGEGFYAISPSGYSHIEEMYLKESSNLRALVDSDFAEFVSEQSSKNDEAQNLETEIDVPASDRFVSIGDNLPGYQQVVVTVEQASEAVRASNILAAEDRSWIRIHIEAGLELLRKGGTVLRSALQSLIVEPLKAAIKEESEGGMKTAIRAALDAIKLYLGI